MAKVHSPIPYLRAIDIFRLAREKYGEGKMIRLSPVYGPEKVFIKYGLHVRRKGLSWNNTPEDMKWETVAEGSLSEIKEFLDAKT